MTAKHMPGEWKVNQSEDCKFWIGDANQFSIAEITQTKPSNPKMDFEAEANARLIAAAPEMLAELENWLELFCEDDGQIISDQVKATKAIIRKVRGE